MAILALDGLWPFCDNGVAVIDFWLGIKCRLGAAIINIMAAHVSDRMAAGGDPSTVLSICCDRIFIDCLLGRLRCIDVASGRFIERTLSGAKMAAGVTALWHQKYHTKLSYVMGLRFEAGNVAFYSEDKPQVYIDADSVKSFGLIKRI